MKKNTLLIFLFILFTIKSNAQSVAEYIFSQSTETYVPVVGISSTANGDDGTQNTIPIGFNFNYGSNTYTTFSISTNGFIRLGNPIGNFSWTNLLANASPQSPLIAPFWDDNNRGGGNIGYAVSGNAPNRALEVGWDNVNIGAAGSVSQTDSGSFKIRLHETGEIDFIYGSVMTSAGTLSASIGLNDLTSFLSVTPGSTDIALNISANNAINSTVFLVNKKYTFTPQPSCSGIPNPGNSVAAVSVCSGINFYVSLQNPAVGSGITYQWMQSIDGVTFDTIAGANNSVLVTSQSSLHFYKCIVACGNNSTTSNAVEVGMRNLLECFCSPTYTNGKTDGDLISNVAIAGTTLSNNTGTVPINPYYTYFTGQANYTATLESGHTYQMSVTVGTFQNQNISVWIDFNDDAVFASEENIGYSGVIGANGTGIFTINLPCDLRGGTHRMRIRDVYNTGASSIQPCANYGYGETEDYDVTIIEATDCQAPFNLQAITINPTSAELGWTSVCGPVSSDLHFTLQGGGLPTGDPSHPNVISSIVLPNLQPSTAYDFYVRSHCTSTGVSEWVGPYTFTTLPPGVINDDCETAIALIPGSTFEEHAVVATNRRATRSIGPPDPTCAIFNFGGDVWFNTRVPADGNITIEVHSNPGSPLIDTGMSVFSGSCNELVTLGCSDDEGIDAFSKLDLTGRTPNETLYIRVWEYANDTFGTFQVSAWSPTLKAAGFDTSNFSTYPNPVKDIMNVSYKKDITNIVIFNMLGQQVMVKEMNCSQCQIDLTTLSKGTYMMKISTIEETETLKVIRE